MFDFELSVIDEGIGLNDRDRKSLFDLFFRSSDEQNRLINPATNGIGLYISKKLALAM